METKNKMSKLKESKKKSSKPGVKPKPKFKTATHKDESSNLHHDKGTISRDKTQYVTKAIRAKKRFIVVAYDISDNRKRNKVMKALLKYGTRINYSVFECMVTDAQFEILQKEVKSRLNPKTDTVAFYPICLKCYTKISYMRPHKPKHETTAVI